MHFIANPFYERTFCLFIRFIPTAGREFLFASLQAAHRIFEYICVYVCACKRLRSFTDAVSQFQSIWAAYEPRNIRKTVCTHKAYILIPYGLGCM